ncbi:MAG: sulfatase-like hydrolase/transferase [Candidatus Sumerlaeaceae bacterium]
MAVQHSRALYLGVLGIIIAMQASGTAIAASDSSATRNVLLLISDDHGLDAGCYGNKAVQTPTIDRLAREGVLFTSAFAAVSSCSPSRATIMTGRYNHAVGQYGLSHAAHNQQTRPEVQSVPKILSEAGYRTGMVGKYHLGPDAVYPFDLRVGEKLGRDSQALGRHAREFLSSVGTAPFFLTIGFSDTHRLGSHFPANQPDAHTTNTLRYDGALPHFLMDLPEVRRDYAAYCESVNNLDRSVAQILSAIDEAGATSSTLVIFLSDNGIPFPGAKTNLYDAGIRLPLIVRAPGTVHANTRSDSMVSWIDIAPTILDWAGLQAPKAMRGTSLFSTVNDPAADKNRPVYASHTFHEITMYYPMRCVRTRDYKLIWNLANELPFTIAGDLEGSPSWTAVFTHPHGQVGGHPVQQYLRRPRLELFDLKSDPNERSNLSQDSRHKATLDKLTSNILDMMRESRDPWLDVATRQLEQR